MISVLHVVDLSGPNPWLNGVATHYDRSNFCHEVVSLGPRNAMHEALAERRVSSFALNVTARWQYPAAVNRLRRLIKQRRPDIVQTHLFDPSVVGLIAAKLAGKSFNVVTRHHSDFTTVFNRPLHRRIDRWQAMAANRVMAASEAVKRAMMQYERVPEDRISVARYGYDFDSLKPVLTSAQRRNMRESLGGDNRLLIGTVSRLSIEKGHEYLLRAMQPIVRRFPETRLILVGTGPLRAELERMVAELNLTEFVQFLGWRSDAWQIIEAMDLMVHPTLHEAFCSVIIESMALERPLIATDIAAAPEQIDHEETGILVPARDPAALTAAILRLIEDRVQAEEMGCEARRRVNARFNFPRMMRVYEQLYASWLSESSGHSLHVSHAQ